MILQEEKWVIMSKDRTSIFKGTEWKRMLPVNETKNRILTYHTEALAQTALNTHYPYTRADLEVVKVNITIQEV
jgi:hypothetical protein